MNFFHDTCRCRPKDLEFPPRGLSRRVVRPAVLPGRLDSVVFRTGSAGSSPNAPQAAKQGQAVEQTAPALDESGLPVPLAEHPARNPEPSGQSFPIPGGGTGLPHPAAANRYPGPPSGRGPATVAGVFSQQGPSLGELAVQALSSTQRGYDLLAPKFDHTPFRTPEPVLTAVEQALRPLGPFTAGLDVCCGTGAGVETLRRLCERQVTGLDFSAGMLAVARSRVPAPSEEPSVHWVRADALRLPFAPAFDLAVSFGAFGHFLPDQRPRLFAEIRAALRPGGRFAFPVAAPPRVGTAQYWALWGFDTVMHCRNALRRPRFVMYYRTFRFPQVRAELARAGFTVETYALTGLGSLPDGSPRCRLVVAQRS